LDRRLNTYLTCIGSASRRTGTSTLAELARVAHGPHLETMVVVALCLLCGFVAVAYARLLRDLLAIFLAPFADDQGDTRLADRALVVAATVALFPLSLYRELHRLRYAGFLSFGGSIAVAALFASRAAHLVSASASSSSTTTVETTRTAFLRAMLRGDPTLSTWAVAVEALPIMAMSYICQFNVLSVHARLRDPTRGRLKALLHVACGVAFSFYAVFGASGQLVCADVPNTVAQDALSCLAYADAGGTDPLLACAGGAFALSLLLNTPALIIPLRDSLELLTTKLLACGRVTAHSVRRRRRHRYSRPLPPARDDSAALLAQPPTERTPLEVDRARDGDDDPEWGASSRPPPNKVDDAAQSATTAPPRDAGSATTPQPPQPTKKEPATILHTAVHVVITAGLVAGVVVAAQKVPGVASVWAVAGSSVGLFVAYLLPCFLYLKVRGHKEGGPAFVRNALCVVLFVFSLVLAIVCTYHNTKGILSSSSSS